MILLSLHWLSFQKRIHLFLATAWCCWSWLHWPSWTKVRVTFCVVSTICCMQIISAPAKRVSTSRAQSLWRDVQTSWRVSLNVFVPSSRTAVLQTTTRRQRSGCLGSMSKHSSPQRRQCCLKLKVVDPDRHSRFSADVSSEPFNALNLFRCLLMSDLDVYVDTQSLWQSTSKCSSANSLLARSSWRALDMRLLDSMIVCILSVSAMLSSFLLPFSLQKMQQLSVLQLYLQQEMHILQKIFLWTLLKRLNLIFCPSKHWDSHQNYFDVMCSYWDIYKNDIFSNGGLNMPVRAQNISVIYTKTA